MWKVFRDEGANEYATWMLEYWNGNPPGDYYPGDEYVDWLGLSCQSWWSGTTGRQGPYRSLGELVSPNYDYWTSVHKDKPIMIGEMSTEKHTKQHEWYIDAFRYIKTRPRIGAAIIIDVPYGDFTFGQDLDPDRRVQKSTTGSIQGSVLDTGSLGM